MDELIRFIILSTCVALVIVYFINKISTFILGLTTIRVLIINYITIKKVKAIKDLQDDFFKSEDKSKVGERHLDNLNRVQTQKIEDHLESCIGYYPSKTNLIAGFFKWLFSTNEKFAIPETGYNYMMVLANFVESNKEYLNFEIVVNEKTETK